MTSVLLQLVSIINLYLKFTYNFHYNIFIGASPKNLPVFESMQDELKDKIVTFRTKEDFLDLEDAVHNPKYKNTVIIGGGFLGSELACSLARNCRFLLHLLLLLMPLFN